MRQGNFNIFIFIVFQFIGIAANNKIKMYIFTSPSHHTLRDAWFLPSLQDDYEIIEEKYEQECSGVFLESGWTGFTQHKIDLVLRAIEENWGKIFIYSDVDIQFFAPTQNHIEDLIGDCDMVVQKEDPKGGVCSGFFACKGNETNKCLWQAVKRLMQSDSEINDQLALNMLIYHYNPFSVQWKLLPVTFFNGGILTGYLWNPGDELELPDGIILHHANWTLGTAYKIEQLRYVKEKVLAKKFYC